MGETNPRQLIIRRDENGELFTDGTDEGTWGYEPDLVLTISPRGVCEVSVKEGWTDTKIVVALARYLSIIANHGEFREPEGGWDGVVGSEEDNFDLGQNQLQRDLLRNREAPHLELED